MSDAPPPSDSVNVEVNGVPLKARKGAMIIHVTDANGVYVPRFCYHDKLPIAANCRMCLVEVEKAPKPLPACATPVAEGMKIFTHSTRALGAQKATMEFLLINHPLDCPICDQGGECELQDLAVGYGRSVSRYAERKRVVKDQDIGPLVSTDMTRCIHCTRCVRFGQDIAGIQELGTTGRGENMQIGTYIEKSVAHELSGNIIDLCPVGALNSKPFRFSARAWEMTQEPLVSPHDGVGSNLYAHVLRGRLMRVVPRQNEAINETWIADRDRFSYEGIYSDERVQRPLVRTADGGWRETDWETALEAAARGMRGNGELGVLAHPSSSIEELYLLGRLAEGLGSANIDHRLRQRDFRDQDDDALQPSLGLAIADIEKLSALLVVGSNLRAEVPVLAHRVRKAARAGAAVQFLNPVAYDYLFPVALNTVAPVAGWTRALAGVLAAALSGATPTDDVAALLDGVKPGEEHAAMAAALQKGERRAIWLGALAIGHPDYATLRRLARELARLTGASFGELAEGGNAAGACLAGVLPHRAVGGAPRASAGLHARAMLERPLGAYLLFGTEPWADSRVAQARQTLSQARCVVSITPFAGEETRALSHVILPAGTFAETSGTWVNLEGTWQSVAGAVKPVGEARPGWKILRVLGNQLGLPGYEYQTSADVLAELRDRLEGVPKVAYRSAFKANGGGAAVGVLLDIPMYHVDPLLRRAGSLQRTPAGMQPAAAYPES